MLGTNNPNLSEYIGKWRLDQHLDRYYHPFTLWRMGRGDWEWDAVRFFADRNSAVRYMEEESRRIGEVLRF